MAPKTKEQDVAYSEGHTTSRSFRSVVLKLLLICLLIGMGVILGIILYAANALKPTEMGEIKIVNIPAGTGSSQIAYILEEEGIIQDAFMFRMLLRYEGEGNAFQAGQYEMNPGMTIDDIITKLNAGDVIEELTHRLTIPEGWTIEQIADQLPNELDAEAFLQAARQPELFEFKYRESIPQDDRIKYAFEGYLFPETYEFKQDITEIEVIQRMLSELEMKLDQLPEGWQEEMAKLNLNFHELMTIASLIEREVIVDHERPIVAGVIFNRINQGMKLQIDATVQYAIGEQKERLFHKDLEIESPYNTYQIIGIPPGPIASPSLASIKAALYPELTDYLFYVTKKDGSHEHLFGRTHDEHLRNIEISKQTAASAASNS